MVQLLQIMQLNSTPIVGMIGPQSNEVTNLLAFSSSVGMPLIMVSVTKKMHNDTSIIICGVPGSWEREGRLRYSATTANVTSYTNYSAEVPPKSKELLIL